MFLTKLLLSSFLFSAQGLTFGARGEGVYILQPDTSLVGLMATLHGGYGPVYLGASVFRDASSEDVPLVPRVQAGLKFPIGKIMTIDPNVNLFFGDAITPSIEFYDGVTLGVGFESPVYSLGSGATGNIRLEVLPLLYSVSVGISLTADQNYRVYERREGTKIAAEEVEEIEEKPDTAQAKPSKPSPSKRYITRPEYSWDNIHIDIPEVKPYPKTSYKTRSQCPNEWNQVYREVKHLIEDPGVYSDLPKTPDVVSWKIASRNDMEVKVYADMDVLREGYRKLLALNPELGDPILEVKLRYGWGLLVAYMFPYDTTTRYGSDALGDKLGLKVGDVIRRCNGEECRGNHAQSLRPAYNPRYISEEHRFVKTDSVLLEILRGDETINIWVNPYTVYQSDDGFTGMDRAWLKQLADYQPDVYPDLEEALETYTDMGIRGFIDFYDPGTYKDILLSLGFEDDERFPPHSKITCYEQMITVETISAGAGGILFKDDHYLTLFKYNLRSPTLNKNGEWWIR